MQLYLKSMIPLAVLTPAPDITIMFLNCFLPSPLATSSIVKFFAPLPPTLVLNALDEKDGKDVVEVLQTFRRMLSDDRSEGGCFSTGELNLKNNRLAVSGR